MQRVERLREIGSTRELRFRRALGLCRAERIDLASAYGVLLGLMELDRAREMMNADPTLIRKLYPRFDPAFRRAVSDGRLTADEAERRGDRIVHATSLMLDHDLTMNVAFQITDNERTLEDAKRRHRSAAGATPPAVRSGAVGSAPEAAAQNRVWIIPIAAGVFVGALLAAFSIGESAPEPPPSRRVVKHDPQPAPPAGPRWPNTTVSKNADGRVTRLYGGTPRDIVEAFCAESLPIDRCESVGVRATTPHRPDVMVGTVRMPGADNELWIRRHPSDHAWFAGNGVEPIEIKPAER